MLFPVGPLGGDLINGPDEGEAEAIPAARSGPTINTPITTRTASRAGKSRRATRQQTVDEKLGMSAGPKMSRRLLMIFAPSAAGDP